jgi:cation diffusion facilitator CzcD-associated flavoprotein CzcO
VIAHSHFDVLIIGAGLSGIGAAWHIQNLCPDRSYAILESRAAMGGTWDLFRYPGIRSDSDMYTLGYRFRPWRDAKAIADGPAIKRYIEETAREHGINQKIRYGHRVVRAEWSSEEALWKVEAEHEGASVHFTCGFLYTCTGYYDYEAGYTPEYPGREIFAGRFVHPQHWPDDLDYSGKRVVVIGSGATAVTLVPAMTTGPGAAAHVTMLQRSPTYVAEQPSTDAIADALRRALPAGVAYALARWKNLLRSIFYFVLARGAPGVFARGLRQKTHAALGAEYDVGKHFTPRYKPWDERLCIIPDGDLFTAIREQRASVVTDEIASFTATGIQLKSGEHLAADVIVSATGLALKLVGGMALVVDGKPVEMPNTMAYKGLMYSGVPNLASAFGYTNASWTLKCDLIAEHVCRLLNFMKAHDYVQCMPVRDPSVGEEPVLNFTSGYVQRALPSLPTQGTRAPWRVHQNYVLDLLAFRHGRVDNPSLQFKRRT